LYTVLAIQDEYKFTITARKVNSNTQLTVFEMKVSFEVGFALRGNVEGCV